MAEANQLKLLIIPDFSRFDSEIKKLGGKLQDLGVMGSPGKSEIKGVQNRQGADVLKTLCKIALAVGILSAFYEAIGPIFGTVLKLLAALILTILQPFLKTGLEFFQVIAPRLLDATTKLAEKIEAAFGKSPEYFKSPEFKNAEFLDQAIEVLVNPIDALQALWNQWVEDAKNWDFGTFIINLLTAIGGAVKGTLETIGSVTLGILGAIGTWLFNAIKNALNSTISKLSELANWLLSLLK